MSETVGQHSVATFTSPVNGTSPIDANTVKGNDNTIRSAYVDHDADPGIHVQSSTLASRPVANSAGRKWMTQDSGVIRLFYDDGTNWYEVDYLRTTGGTISGNLSISGTLAVTGVATLTAQPILSSLTASQAVFTDASKGLVSNAITGTGNVVMSASPTLTGTIGAASMTLSGTLGVTGLLTFASLKGTGATTVTNILDEDNMASDSATALATQQSIKAYVDAQVGASDALSEVLAIGNTTGANDIIVSTGQKIRTPAVAAGDGTSAITIANTTGALTLATALADSNLATISTAGKVANSATTATALNTSSAIVARDSSGNFTAGTITATLSGAAPAGSLSGTTLASNVVSSSLTSVGTLTSGAIGSGFTAIPNSALANSSVTVNGTAIALGASGTVTAAAGTLTGTTLASNVVSSSLTSVGTLSSLTVSGDLTVDTSTLKVDSTNNRVGIGTASPSYRTDISNGGGSAAALRVLGNDQSNVRLRIENSGSGGRAFELTGGLTGANNSDFTLYDATAAATRLSVDASGNLAVDTNTLYVDAANNRVGIGTASPRRALEVSGSAGGSSIQATDTANSTNFIRMFSDVTDGAAINVNTGGIIRFAHSAENFGSFTERMRLDASGNLGVGASPSAAYRLLSKGAGAASARFESAGSDFNNPSVNLFDSTRNVEMCITPGNGIGSIGTYSNHAFTLHTNNTERMRLDSSGNLGLGVTPSAWGSGRRALVLGASKAAVSTQTGFGDISLSNNAYHNGTSWIYEFSTAATRYDLYNGAHSWYTAPSGTAGNAITFTQAMTLDASGNLGLGTTPRAWQSSPRWRALDFGSSIAAIGTSEAYFSIVSNAYRNTSNQWIYNSTNAVAIYGMEEGAHIWSSAASGSAGSVATVTERARIDASGNLLVGTSTAPGSNGGGIAIYRSDFPRLTFRNSTSGDGTGDGTNLGLFGSEFSIYNQEAAGFIAFGTAGTERARITSGGYFKASDAGTYQSSTGNYHELRSSTNGAQSAIISHTDAAGCYGLDIRFSGGSPDNNTNWFLQCNDSTTTRCYIWSDGDLANHDGVYGTISDERLKRDIVDAGSQWDDLKAIRFRKYRMKTDVAANPDAPAMLGVVAQELEQVSPGLVDEHPDFEEREVTDEDGNVTTERVQVGTTKTVKSSILLMKAAVALQEAMARIESLEARLAALEN